MRKATRLDVPVACRGHPRVRFGAFDAPANGLSDRARPDPAPSPPHDLGPRDPSAAKTAGLPARATPPTSSPHARGSSCPTDEPTVRAVVVPARAGIVPGIANSRPAGRRRPRTRGDRPIFGRDPVLWTTVVPACAGIVLDTQPCSTVYCSRPRTRGDRPAYDALTAPVARVVPARAGIVGPYGLRSLRWPVVSARGIVPTAAGAGARWCRRLRLCGIVLWSGTLRAMAHWGDSTTGDSRWGGRAVPVGAAACGSSGDRGVLVGGGDPGHVDLQRGGTATAVAEPAGRRRCGCRLRRR